MVCYYGLFTEPSDVRLVGGTSHCNGILEMKHQGDWRPLDGQSDWNLKSSSVVCRQLDCGSDVSTQRTFGSTVQPVWWITTDCVGHEPSLRECRTQMSHYSTVRLEMICSGNTNNDDPLSICLLVFKCLLAYLTCSMETDGNSLFYLKKDQT